jgi:hypothetical protein
MLCPNCHQEAPGLYSSPSVGGEGVKHCGCYYEGDATGKEYHFSTEPPFVLAAMLKEPEW